MKTDSLHSMVIYTITHNATGRIYVGQTKNKVNRRWSAHCAKSNKTKHGIVGAIKKYGKESFTFEVIDVAESMDQLNHKERFWILKLNSMAPVGFNLDSGGNLYKIVTEETKKKQRSSRKAWLASGVDTKQLGNGARGRKRRPSEIEAIVRGLKGRVVSPETREKIASAQRNVPKPLDRVLKMTLDRMQGKVIKRSDGVIFISYAEAARLTGVSTSAIHNAVSGKSKSSGGFTWSLEGVSDDSVRGE